jgi:hypothetical protein
MSDVSVMQVNPMFLEIETEMRVSKKVPVVSQVNVVTLNQFGVLGSTRISPDSITVTGPSSRVESVMSWNTIDSEVEGVSSDLEMTVDLETPGSGITVMPMSVTLQAEIAEFTEAKWLRIGGYWYPRGGIPIDIFYQTGEPPEGVWIPPQDVPNYRGRG